MSSDDDPLRASVLADMGSLAAAYTQRRPAPELPAGTVIDHFVIEAAIGQGGMGAVYRAHDRELERRVAIKLGLGGTDLARARREAMALARLAHPNVVTIYEIGEHEGVPFVAMELCEGGTVRTWMAAERRTWRQILAVFVEAGRGLGAAHAAGLVHRDVKPDNILLGSDGRARIADFGLAHGPHASDEDAGARVGTPRYMAPEQLAGERVDARTDQFAFCLALYEALTGVDPFPPAPSERRAAIAASRIEAPPRGVEVPRKLLAVVEQGLAPAPARRFATMEALLAAIARAIRPRWGLAAVIAGVVVVGAAVGITMVARDRAMTQAAELTCAQLPADLAPGWTATARRDFIDGNPNAGGTARWAAEQIDREVRVLAAGRTACKDLMTRADRSGMKARAGGARCLTQVSRELARVGALRERDVGELTTAVGQLVASASCITDLTAGASAPDRAGPIWDQLATAESLAARGELARAIEIARKAQVEAQADGGEIIITRAEYTLGTILEQQARGHDDGAPTIAPSTSAATAPAATTTRAVTADGALAPDTTPALVVAGGELHAFARTPAGVVLGAHTAAGAWSAFAPIVDATTGTPLVCGDDPSAGGGDGRIDVFCVQAVTGHALHAVTTSGAWTVTDHDGLIATVGSSLAIDPTQRITFYTPDPSLYPWFDQRVWFLWTFTDATKPARWRSIPEHVTPRTTPSAVWSAATGRLHVVALDNRGHVAWQSGAGTDIQETRWIWRPAAMGPAIDLEEPVIALTRDESSGTTLVIVVRSSDGRLWLARKRRDAADFGGLEELAVSSSVAPVTVVRDAGQLTVLGRDDGGVFAVDVDEVTPDSVAVGPVTRFPTFAAQRLSATRVDGAIVVVGVTSDGNLLEGRYLR